MNKYQYSAVEQRWKWTPMEESVPPERLRDPATGILDCIVLVRGIYVSSAYWSRTSGWYCLGIKGYDSSGHYVDEKEITHWMPKPPINPDWKPRR